jgi:hypothetical protein
MDPSSDGSGAGPDGPDGPMKVKRSAVCCSGGGIRSASFALGAMQALARRGVLSDDVGDVTAVSGGSYLAASRAVVSSSVPAEETRGVYAPRSPEERHLRSHTHYLVPNGPTTLRATLCVIFGLALNLSLLVAWIVAIALPLGWLSHAHGPLVYEVASAHPTLRLGNWPWIPGALGGICLILFAVSSSGVTLIHRRSFHKGALSAQVEPPAQGCTVLADERGPSRWLSCAGIQQAMWLTFLAAAAAAFALIVAPWAIVQIYREGPNIQGSATTHVTGSVGTFFAALVAVLRLMIGRVGGKAKDTNPKQGKGEGQAGGSGTIGVTSVVDQLPGGLKSRIQHVLLPWVGSAVAALLLVVVWLVAEVAGARNGFVRSQVWIFGGVLAYLMLGRVLVDVNRTSLHSLYRDRLASAFAVRRRSDAGVEPAGGILMSNLRGSISSGSPSLVVCATANVTASGEVPAGTNGVSFTFRPDTSGLQRPIRERAGSTALYRRVDTEVYERVVGIRHLTLFDMVAISGAAVSPIMGKMTRPAERFMLALANIRLGVWLPHPALMPVLDEPEKDSCKVPLISVAGRGYGWRGWWWYRRFPKDQVTEIETTPADAMETRLVRLLSSRRSQRFAALLRRRFNLAPHTSTSSLWGRAVNEVQWRSAQPGLRLLLREALGRTSLQSRWLYVTDGGHFDNLGLIEALRGDPEEVFVFDASGDGPTSWSTIGEAVALARVELGVDIDVEPTEMVQAGKVVRPFVRGHFRREGHWGGSRTIWFCKLGVWPGAPWDVRAYSARHASFPSDSTLQQLYDGEEFEAYRELGFAATMAMLDERASAPTRLQLQPSPQLSSPSSITLPDASPLTVTVTAPAGLAVPAQAVVHEHSRQWGRHRGAVLWWETTGSKQGGDRRGL